MLKDNLLDFFGGVAPMQIVGHFVELGHLIVPRLQLTIVALLIFHPKFVLRYIMSYDDDFLYLTAVFQDRDALRLHVANTLSLRTKRNSALLPLPDLTVRSNISRTCARSS